MKYNPKKNSRYALGFTIIEAMAAMGIFTVGFLGMSSAHSSILQIARKSVDNSLASNLGSSIVEQLRLLDPNAVLLGDTLYYDRRGIEQGSAASPTYFTVTYSATRSSGGLSYLDLTVVVTWGDSNQHSLTLYGRRMFDD